MPPCRIFFGTIITTSSALTTPPSQFLSVLGCAVLSKKTKTMNPIAITQFWIVSVPFVGPSLASYFRILRYDKCAFSWLHYFCRNGIIYPHPIGDKRLGKKKSKIPLYGVELYTSSKPSRLNLFFSSRRFLLCRLLFVINVTDEKIIITIDRTECQWFLPTWVHESFNICFLILSCLIWSWRMRSYVSRFTGKLDFFNKCLAWTV